MFAEPSAQSNDETLFDYNFHKTDGYFQKLNSIKWHVLAQNQLCLTNNQVSLLRGYIAGKYFTASRFFFFPAHKHHIVMRIYQDTK